MRKQTPASLKFLFLGLCLLTASCASVDTAVNNTIRATDIAKDNLEDISDTAASIPTGSEDYLRSNCPSVKLVNELGVFTDYTNFKNAGKDNLITQVRVSRLSTSCSYTDRSVTVDINLLFEGQLGPAAQRGPHETFFSYPFFIAITSPQNVVMARQVFAAPMAFAPGQTMQTHTEHLRQVIPLQRPTDGPGHNILVGFQLNKHQLAYNRAHAEETRALVLDATNIYEPAHARPAAMREVVVEELRPAPVMPVDSRPSSLVPAGR
ncbi:MAG: hypothetical protein ACT4OY_06110 [Alphaproteobacteria bacterium]